MLALGEGEDLILSIVQSRYSAHFSITALRLPKAPFPTAPSFPSAGTALHPSSLPITDVEGCSLPSALLLGTSGQGRVAEDRCNLVQ